nr:immunoglobulin light chain junction region [Mus musculus]NSM03143.1 immunoglobulin light chain junction region [Mus musculus]NSM03173.1 immunoglobulin light chain junction region [Mus musculus]NSM03185.1 immunoglobulin light chain junction region [Mus musculus]NSM03193.1 immunoglobulin light chain junction region [Mus musculus]
CALWYNNHWVF